MNNQQNRVQQPMREMTEEHYKNRVWFTLLTIGGILIILLVAYEGRSLGLGSIGSVGVWVSARVIANYSDVKIKQMDKKEKELSLVAPGETKAQGAKIP